MSSKYVEGVPGSLYLLEERRDLPAGKQDQIVGEDAIILDPTPSDDVNDPLNWSRNRKFLAIVCVYVYVFFYGTSSTVIYSLIVAINEDTGIPVATLISTGYLFGLLGWFGPISLSLTFRYGARPSYLISMLANVAINVWTPYITTSGAWLGSRVIQGCTGCQIETLVEISIAQLFFSHERGRYIGIYAFLVFGSNYFAPAISGFVYQGIGWHWTMYWAAFLCVFGSVFLFLFQEETNYNRSNISSPSIATADEKKNDVTVNVTDAASIHVKQTRHGRIMKGTPKTYLQKLKLYNGTFLSWKGVWTCMWRPFWLIVKPAFNTLVLFNITSYVRALLEVSFGSKGASLCNYSILNATLAPILTSPPYNFSTAVSAQIYYAPLIGVFIGGQVAGYFGDKYAIWAAHRNNGIREPEQKLALLGISAIFVPAGMILWGVGAAHGIHWVGLAFGAGFVGFTNGISATLTLGYALDCYRELTTEVMIGVILVRNSLAFGIGYGISPWLDGLGQQNCFISAAFVGMAIVLTFIPVMCFGKRLRTAQRDTFWADVSKYGQDH